MIAVIQCAASKRSDAGRLRTAHGVPVEFVADPQAAPADPSRTYARPDDLSDNRTSWRQLLVAYNQEPGSNPLGLYPAYQLYENRAYGRLVDSFGLSNVYVLSAGWGLIRADFLTPHYDITTAQAPINTSDAEKQIAITTSACSRTMRRTISCSLAARITYRCSVR